jgi:hypothetical protein
VGRHSAPDPDESPEQPEEPQTERFGAASAGAPDHGFDAESAYERFDGPGYPDDRRDYDVDPDYRPGYDADYDAEFDDRPSFAAAERDSTPEPVTGRSGPQHGGDWDGGEWTGSHRAVTAGRRGVSIGVVAALVTVIVVVAAVILWRFFGDALSSRSDAAAARCVDGEVAVAVVADPSVSDNIKTLADKYNKTAAPVGDRCVKVSVRPADSDQVVNGFIGAWPTDLGDRPALWIPASSISEARLEAAAGPQTVSDSRSLVTSPVVLAVRPQLKDALAQQNWGTLASLQSTPNSLDALNLKGWGSLRLALPLSGDSDASYLAAEAVAAAAAPPGAPATAGTTAVNTLLSGQPKLADTKAATAMDALLGGNDPASAPVHAVVATEQQVFQRGGSLNDAKSRLAAWLPPAPAAIADYPTVLLAGNWLSQEQVTAASEFARFMRKPEQLGVLAKAGFRTPGATMPKSDVTSFASLGAPLSVGDSATRATLASALTAPVGAPAATIMLDQSMPEDEGGKSRLANVTAALNARLRALPPNAAIGLWTFDGVSGRSEIALGPLSDQVDGKPRLDALSADLDSQTASNGGAVSFTTLRMLYDQLKTNYRDGQSNSVLVITTGPHTDQSLDGPGLEQYIRGAFDPAKPIAVNVIDFGSDSDRDTWQAVSQATGGSYQNLDSSSSPQLSTAITQMLS